jgi:hypothetical protein
MPSAVQKSKLLIDIEGAIHPLQQNQQLDEKNRSFTIPKNLLNQYDPHLDPLLLPYWRTGLIKLSTLILF